MKILSNSELLIEPSQRATSNVLSLNPERWCYARTPGGGSCPRWGRARSVRLFLGVPGGLYLALQLRLRAPHCLVRVAFPALQTKWLRLCLQQTTSCPARWKALDEIYSTLLKHTIHLIPEMSKLNTLETLLNKTAERNIKFNQNKAHSEITGNSFSVYLHF